MGWDNQIIEPKPKHLMTMACNLPALNENQSNADPCCLLMRKMLLLETGCLVILHQKAGKIRACKAESKTKLPFQDSRLPRTGAAK
jgi:hypothetical protein